MQANRRDLCGQRFGKLTVIRRVEGTQSNRARADSWLCRCDCGNESVVLGSNLVRGHTKSCGCIKLNDLTGQHSIRNSHIADCGCRRSKRYANADITGQRFGRLTALYATDRRDNAGYKIWHCYCDCGNEIDVSYKALVYGNQQSCGCKKREHESELGTYLTHIDGTSIEALKSSKIPSNNTTGVRGVYCVKGRYKAKIVFQKKQFSLGTYDTLAEAATARKKAEKMLKSEVIAFYERWTAKAAANPAWAKENPIHFQVTKNGAEELELQLAPKLDPETH